MTQQEKLQQDIQFAQNRLQAKLNSLPVLKASTLPEWMKQVYLAGIEHERTLIAKWTAQLAK